MLYDDIFGCIFFFLLFPVFKVDFNCGVYNVLTVTLTNLTETQADLTFTLIDLTVTLADLSQIIIFFFVHVLRHCCRVSIYCWYNYGTKRPHSRYIFLNVLKLLKQNANYKYVAIDLCNLYVLHFTVCKDSKHCRLYNASRICITNGIYYEWSQKHCPAYCGYCQGSYSSFKIGTFILRFDSTQRPEK